MSQAFNSYKTLFSVKFFAHFEGELQKGGRGKLPIKVIKKGYTEFGITMSILSHCSSELKHILYLLDHLDFFFFFFAASLNVSFLYINEYDC